MVDIAYVQNLAFIEIPGGFAYVDSPKMMSDCHMLRMNVCDAGRQDEEMRKKVDSYKSVGLNDNKFEG